MVSAIQQGGSNRVENRFERRQKGDSQRNETAKPGFEQNTGETEPKGAADAPIITWDRAEGKQGKTRKETVDNKAIELV